MNYNDALAFAKKKHNGQFRKEGIDYISHPIAVSKIIREKGFDLEYQITALFHDLLEDTDATIQEIINYSSFKVLDAVKLLTKSNEYEINRYLSAISADDMAYNVKLADRLHNLGTAKKADLSFVNKYIEETKKHYIQFAEGSVIYEELVLALGELIEFRNIAELKL